MAQSLSWERRTLPYSIYVLNLHHFDIYIVELYFMNKTNHVLIRENIFYRWNDGFKFYVCEYVIFSGFSSFNHANKAMMQLQRLHLGHQSLEIMYNLTFLLHYIVDVLDISINEIF